MPPTEVPDDELLERMVLSPDPIVTTSELQDHFDLSQQALHSRLVRFESEGKVASKKVGAKARVWWVTQDGRDFLND